MNLILMRIAVFDKILLSLDLEYGRSRIIESSDSEIQDQPKYLGVCLGQQAIGEVYGGTLSNLDKVYLVWLPM
jgi:anthranilate synthase component 2